MVKNYFFIDDSGSKDWDTPYSRSFIDNPPERNNQNLNFWRRNYFVLAGVHISSEAIKRINPLINKIKKETFGTRFVEIKSVWLRNPDKRKRYYLEKYKISEADLLGFTKKWYSILTDNSTDIQIQGFLLDKRFYNVKRNNFTPLQMLVQVLFDRVELHPQRQCTIVFDQMDREIKSIRHQHGQILKISNKEIDLGSFQQKYSHSPPRFEVSRNSNFLQLADNVAYNIYRQYVDFGDLGSGFYKYFDLIKTNFYNKNGKIEGYGIVKVPKN